MKALVLTHYNGPLELQEMPKPELRQGQVLVRIAASGVNPLDIKIRQGGAAHARHPVPLVPGIDLAGVVEAVAPDIVAFKPGDEVYGMTGGVGGIQGTLAEYAAVDADLLAIKPAGLSMRQAAALPLIFITAYSGLIDRAQLKAGQSVLVQGGAGGIGHIAVQLALSIGATVSATASARDQALLAGFGAAAFDYNAVSTEQLVQSRTNGAGFDVVFDTAGGTSLDASFAAVRRYGHVVSALGWGTHALAPLSFREASYSGIFTLHPLLDGQHRAHHGEMLREARRLAEAGQLVPMVDPRHFDMTSIEAAHAAIGDRSARGKIVVDIS